eukprot:7212248-Prymnesium_polylepis.1
MSTLSSALWSVGTSIPQPLMAVVAYCFVDMFVLIQASSATTLPCQWLRCGRVPTTWCAGARVPQPLGLGFAAGAMFWVAIFEVRRALFPESYEACGLLNTAAVAATSGSLMMLSHEYLF